jgi:hypothetical protein
MQAEAQLKTVFETDSNQTASYEACNAYYRNLCSQFRRIPDLPGMTPLYFSIGKSDGLRDIMVLQLNSPLARRADLRPSVIINNAIHAGEPEGVDASMALARDILSNASEWKHLLTNYRVYIIAQYNVDGIERRGCCSRANQNGPDEYGFRASERNLDLNRDFIKADSRNAQAFSRFFTAINARIFVDNHTSNGADYPYTLTYFGTHPAKLSMEEGRTMKQISSLLDSVLPQRGWPVAPYVETRREVPDSGINGFFDGGRYATGFAALHHCLGFTVETHMLKPFPQRVRATYAFMQALFEQLNRADIELPERPEQQEWEVISWQQSDHGKDSLLFSGYTAEYRKSGVTGQRRLFYDRARPWQKTIPFYNTWVPVDSVRMPKAYFMSPAWKEVIQRLEWNGIQGETLTRPENLILGASYIERYETGRNPYEGHYLHYQTSCRDTVLRITVQAGWIKYTVTPQNSRFLAQTLHPKAPDSYFNWNFFDAILQQKEWFSAYVFEEKAEAFLSENPAVKAQFEARRAADPAFASDGFAQLYWIYRQSPWYERTNNLYPVFRLE